jgi:protein-disulfide isomerase/uncharacterized membrane protein
MRWEEINIPNGSLFMTQLLQETSQISAGETPVPFCGEMPNQMSALPCMPRPHYRGKAWLARLLFGQLLVFICLTASGMLVVQHVGAWRLPGCGPLSSCAQLAAGRWGNVLGWPVSFLGTAWFAATAVFYWWAGRQAGTPVLFRWVVRCGAMASIFFVAVMSVERHFCPYCLTIHAANLIFWALVESDRRSSVVPYFRPMVAAVVVFAGVSACLGLWSSTVKQDAARRARKEYQESLSLIVAEIQRQKKEPETEDASSGGGLLGGPWRRGPQRAALRLVMFGDYECPHCRMLDQQIEKAAGGRDDISLVFKHYPLCKDCNRQIKYDQLHDNACRAALAVEAAGIVGGNDAWWRMHDWLMARGGRFTEADVQAAAPDLGLIDADAFFASMSGPDALKRIQDDVEDAVKLGIDGTPVVFINGVELAHPEMEDAVVQAIAVADEEHPLPHACTMDRPRPGFERLTAAWAADRQFDLSGHVGHWTLGASDAPHRIVLGICYQNEYSPVFSKAAEHLVARRSDVRVELWHFPLSKLFNSAYARSRNKDYPNSYQMALIAEAAGRAGGNKAFWRMHHWLLDHQAEFSEKTALDAAPDLGINPRRLEIEMKDDSIAGAVDADIAAGAAAGIQGAPSIFLGGRLVPGPEPTAAMMERILEQMDRM